jgi:hypothetical protein
MSETLIFVFHRFRLHHQESQHFNPHLLERLRIRMTYAFLNQKVDRWNKCIKEKTELVIPFERGQVGA